MAEIKRTERAIKAMELAMEICQENRHEFVTPDHLLLALLRNGTFIQTLSHYDSPELLYVRW